MTSLQDFGVLNAWHVEGPDVEIHLSEAYLEDLAANPWFMSVRDLRTSRMAVFTLRWFLSLQSNRWTYQIGLKKLAGHLGFVRTNPAFIQQVVTSSIDDVSWASVKFEDDIFTFKLRRRGSVPIWTLRDTIADSIQQGI